MRFLMWKSPSLGPVHPARCLVTGWSSLPSVPMAQRRGPFSCPSHPMHMLISPTCSQAHSTVSTSTPLVVEWRANRLWEKSLPVRITMDKGAQIWQWDYTSLRLTYFILSNPSRTWFAHQCSFHRRRPRQCIGHLGGSPRHRLWLPSLPEHRGL